MCTICVYIYILYYIYIYYYIILYYIIYICIVLYIYYIIYIILYIYILYYVILYYIIYIVLYIYYIIYIILYYIILYYIIYIYMYGIIWVGSLLRQLLDDYNRRCSIAEAVASFDCIAVRSSRQRLAWEYTSAMRLTLPFLIFVYMPLSKKSSTAKIWCFINVYHINGHFRNLNFRCLPYIIIYIRPI